MDPTQYTDNRRQYIQSIRDNNENPYPHKFNRTHKLNEFHAAYNAKCEEKNVFLDGEFASIAGRVMSIRAAGSKLIFIDI